MMGWLEILEYTLTSILVCEVSFYLGLEWHRIEKEEEEEKEE